jgi:2-polyprenyl-6-methoxyphenol hydroxylase-like FAD-dependent oxidoreductase
MISNTYDIITVGGGLGSSALAKVMAEEGKRVLVLEREREFKDRVRGEYMCPWGVAEARELGIYDLVRDACGTDAPFVDLGFGPRDLRSTTPQRLPSLGFCHPEMQEVMLTAAQQAGAEVQRGVTVTEINPGPTPSVIVQSETETREIKARLVAAADGRTSMARKKGSFQVTEAPQPFFFAGLLLADMTVPEGHAYLLFNPAMGMETAITPVGRGRSRTYVAYQDGAEFRLQGNENIPRFIEEAKRAESVAAYYDGARAIGPLASFRCGEFWVDHPYKDGVVLIGDAAATSDPAFGQGLSLTVRDARVLRDHLRATDDWDAAGHAYATEHDGYYAVTRKVEHWFRSLFLEQGPAADSRRARALPLIAEEQTRVPDHFFSGPDLPADETVRRMFFGEN